jgi:hypothetical protein
MSKPIRSGLATNATWGGVRCERNEISSVPRPKWVWKKIVSDCMPETGDGEVICVTIAHFICARKRSRGCRGVDSGSVWHRQAIW